MLSNHIRLLLHDSVEIGDGHIPIANGISSHDGEGDADVEGVGVTETHEGLWLHLSHCGTEMVVATSTGYLRFYQVWDIFEMLISYLSVIRLVGGVKSMIGAYPYLLFYSSIPYLVLLLCVGSIIKTFRVQPLHIMSIPMCMFLHDIIYYCNIIPAVCFLPC